MLDRSRVLVTGGAGFIGCHLVEALVERHDAKIIVVDNERSGDWRRLQVDVEAIDRDIVAVSVEDWAELCQGVSVVFHLAAEKYNSSRSTPQLVIDTNASATYRLFEGASRSRVERVVFTSSVYAYGSVGPGPMVETSVPAPTTIYGLSKLAGEHLLRTAEHDHDLSWNVARLFFIYGPRQFAEGGYKSVILSNFERIMRGEAPTIYGSGEQALDYVYIDDCVDALLRLAASDSSGQIVNISTGSPITINELTRIMLEVAGSDIGPRSCSPDWTEGTVRWGVPDRAAQLFGWSPTTDMVKGLELVWRWMETQSGRPT